MVSVNISIRCLFVCAARAAARSVRAAARAAVTLIKYMCYRECPLIVCPLLAPPCQLLTMFRYMYRNGLEWLDWSDATTEQKTEVKQRLSRVLIAFISKSPKGSRRNL